MNCKNCGAELNEGAMFCGNCGMKVEEEQTRFEAQFVYEEPAREEYYHEVHNEYQEQGSYQPPVMQEYPAGSAYVPAEKPNTVLWIVLAAIETVFCCSGIGNLLGIVSLVFAILGHVAADKGDFAEAEKKIKAAKIWFWVGIVLAIVAFFFFLAIGVFASIAEELYYY